MGSRETSLPGDLPQLTPFPLLPQLHSVLSLPRQPGTAYHVCYSVAPVEIASRITGITE
jgi:hypothetical protein